MIKVFNPYMKKHMIVSDFRYNRPVLSITHNFSGKDLYVAGALERTLVCDSIYVDDADRRSETCWTAMDGCGNDYFSIPSNDIIYTTKNGTFIWRKARPPRPPTKRQIAIEKRRQARMEKEADKFHPEDYMHDEWD